MLKKVKYLSAFCMILLCHTASAENENKVDRGQEPTKSSKGSFTLDCGHGGTYIEFRLIVDLDSKGIKKSWLIGGTPKMPTDYIIYDIADDEVRAHSDDKFFTEVGVYSQYLALNRYNLHLFMASGEDWNNPAKDGNIKGSGAECKKLEKAF